MVLFTSYHQKRFATRDLASPLRQMTNVPEAVPVYGRSPHFAYSPLPLHTGNHRVEINTGSSWSLVEFFITDILGDILPSKPLSEKKHVHY